jgi:hypothetical protein
MSLGEKLLKAVSVRAVFSALVTCAGNVSPGNSGVWDNTPIVNNGSISAKVNSPQDKTEQMIGLSYKTSEAKAQNMSYNLIDYAWYFHKGYIIIKASCVR